MRLIVILWRLLPIALAFVRDHRRWLFFGAPVRRTASDHERRAYRLVAGQIIATNVSGTKKRPM